MLSLLLFNVAYDIMQRLLFLVCTNTSCTAWARCIAHNGVRSVVPFLFLPSLKGKNGPLPPLKTIQIGHKNIEATC